MYVRGKIYGFLIELVAIPFIAAMIAMALFGETAGGVVFTVVFLLQIILRIVNRQPD